MNDLRDNLYGAGLSQLADSVGGGKPSLRPFFCRIGSKRDLADKIIRLIPKGMKTYVEPFIGGGAVLWKKEPHPVEVINDLDKSLVRDYKLLKSTKARDFPQDLDTLPEIQKFYDTSPRGEANQLAHAIVNRCNKWMGKEFSDKIYNDSNPYNKLKKIEAYQERLKDVRIVNNSYEKVIHKYDADDTFFYCDPPYEPKGTQGKIYKHGEFDQSKLRNELAAIDGKFLLSINDSRNIRELYKGFYYIAFTLAPKSHSTGPGSIGGHPRKELFIANYPISKRKL